MQRMLSDVRLALRQLRKSPGFTLTAIVTLALGIGANAVVFSVLNALILRPVNVPHAGNLVMVQRFQFPSQSYPDYVDLRDRNQTFSSLFAFNILGPVGVDTGGNPTTAWPFLATGNYFDSLGVQPFLGRVFHASDEKGNNSAPYVVLSYDYWSSHFLGDRNVVGRVVAINKHPFTIIGVAPAGFRGTELYFAPALWIPMVDQPMIEGEDDLKWRGSHSLWVMGPLKPGVTQSQALGDLGSIAASLAKTYPSEDDGIKFTLARPGLVGDMLGGPAKAFMSGMMLLAGLILLAACANLGSLFAARSSDRGREVALRLALGSRRGLILRQMFTESILVSLFGGALGVAGGVGILHLISAWQPIPDIPINVPVNPDVRTYIVALVLALVSGLLFGLVPVRQILRADPWQMIRTGMSSTSGSKRIFLLSPREILLIAQIAICAVLVTSSLVAVRGLARSMHSNFGFNPDGVMLATGDLHMAGYTGDRVPQMQRKMLDAVSAIPGVTSVGYSTHLPLSLGGGDSYVYTDTTTDFRPTNTAADSMFYSISPGYLQAAGTRLLAGRDFTNSDDSKSPKVAIINRLFAVKVFGSVQKAIGGHFKYWGSTRAEVIGVVEDGRYRTLTEDPQPAAFFNYQQQPESGTYLVVRSQRDPQEMAAALQHTLSALDPSVPLTIRPWPVYLASALFAARVATVALGVLGMLGAVLAVTGIFGMASYVVSRRLRELGIRVALGAGKRQVLSASLGRAFFLLGAGSIAGIGLGVFAARVLSYIVYQASSRDPLVIGGVAATMLLLGLIAAWIPARRAIAVDPLILLREE